MDLKDKIWELIKRGEVYSLTKILNEESYRILNYYQKENKTVIFMA